MKEKGQQNLVAKLELLAFAVPFGEVPEWSKGPVCKTVQGALITLAGSNPALSARLNSPVRSANYSRGIASGKPKAGLLRSTVILSFSPEESKAQGDVPFVSDRMPEIWETRKSPALPMHYL